MIYLVTDSGMNNELRGQLQEEIAEILLITDRRHRKERLRELVYKYPTKLIITTLVATTSEATNVFLKGLLTIDIKISEFDPRLRYFAGFGLLLLLTLSSQNSVSMGPTYLLIGIWSLIYLFNPLIYVLAGLNSIFKDMVWPRNKYLSFFLITFPIILPGLIFMHNYEVGEYGSTPYFDTMLVYAPYMLALRLWLITRPEDWVDLILIPLAIVLTTMNLLNVLETWQLLQLEIDDTVCVLSSGAFALVCFLIYKKQEFSAVGEDT